MVCRLGPCRSGAVARGLLALAMLLYCAAPGRGADRYVIGPAFGEIAFSVIHLGLFSSQGGFQRWEGNLTLDPDRPEQSQVDVTIDAGSVFVPWEDGTALLRSPPYFDVIKYPAVRFTTTSVRMAAANRYLIRGALQVRGITHPQDFVATLLARRVDPKLGKEVADFVVTGVLVRSTFGMTADSMLISDAVDISISAHIVLGAPPRAP
jgi:polyisoprenoid-binding protein YceI